MTAPAIEHAPRTVRVGDIDISYDDIGSGPPLVLLHGTGPGASGWSNFRLTIPAFADRYRVIVPDLPRFGKSSKVPIRGPRLTVLSGIMAGALSGWVFAVCCYAGLWLGWWSFGRARS